jgi:hypothetical protein
VAGCGGTRACVARLKRSGGTGGVQACAHAKGAGKRYGSGLNAYVDNTARPPGQAVAEKPASAGRCSRSSRCGCRGRRCSRRRGTSRNRAALGVPGIRAVEPGTLEDDAHAVELLAQGPLALGAGRQRAVRERLDDVKGMAAILAGVCIRWHWCSSSWANERSRAAVRVSGWISISSHRA